MSKHTPEPWEHWRETCREDTGKEYATFNIQSAGMKDLIAQVDKRWMKPREGGTYKANADRIVACVNALAGIPDPAAFVSAVRAAVAAGSIEELHLTLIRNAMEGKA